MGATRGPGLYLPNIGLSMSSSSSLPSNTLKKVPLDAAASAVGGEDFGEFMTGLALCGALGWYKEANSSFWRLMRPSM